MQWRFAIAALVLGCASAHAGEVKWSAGSDIQLCEGNKCKVLASRSSLQDVDAVVQGGGGWLEVRDNYRLCVLDHASQPVCENLDAPRLPGVSVCHVWTPKVGMTVRLGFPRGSVDKLGMLHIAARFDDSLRATAALLQQRAGKTSGSWGQVIVANDCHDNIPSFSGPVAMAGCPGDGSDGLPPGTVDPGTVTPPSVPGTGAGSGGWNTGPNAACVASCDASLAAANMYCRALPDARLRAICYGSAMAVYGACLATC